MNWQDLMPTGIVLTAGVPVLRIGTSEIGGMRKGSPCRDSKSPGIVVDADNVSGMARVLLWSNGQQGAADLPSKHAKLVGNTVKCSLFECKIDLDTALGFFWAMRMLQDLYEACDHSQKEEHTFCVAAPDPTNEDRVALARALARIMETT